MPESALQPQVPPASVPGADGEWVKSQRGDRPHGSKIIVERKRIALEAGPTETLAPSRPPTHSAIPVVLPLAGRPRSQTHRLNGAPGERSGGRPPSRSLLETDMEGGVRLPSGETEARRP